MAQTIVQRVKFPADAKTLYAMYMDSRKHTLATGASARIGKVGASFSAWDGYIRGRTVAAVPGMLVAQKWRSTDWKDGDPDSTFVLTFTPIKGGCEVTMVHAGVPNSKAASLAKGWYEYYWNPWRAWIKRNG